MLAGVVTGFSNLTFNILVARTGGVEAYGGMGALLVFGTMGTLLAVGLQYAVARRAALSSGRARGLLYIGLRGALPWTGIAAIGMVAAAPLASYLHLPGVLPIVLAFLLFLTVVVLAVPTGVLIGQRRFGAVAMVMLAPAFLRIMLAIPLTRHHDPIAGALTASLLPMVAAVSLAIVLALRSRPSKAVPAASDTLHDRLDGVAADGVAGAFLAAAIWAVWSLPLLFGRHGLSAVAASALTAAELIASGIVLVAGSIATALFPSIARRRSGTAVVVGLIASIIVAFVGTTLLVTLGPTLLPRLYGPRFTTSVPLLCALSASLLLVVAANYLLWAVRALQRLALATTAAAATALSIQLGLGVLWHSSATLLALEPALAIAGGLFAGALIAKCQRRSLSILHLSGTVETTPAPSEEVLAG
jgi:O-antigen/teichoic acid export membrane protein